MENIYVVSLYTEKIGDVSTHMIRSFTDKTKAEKFLDYCKQQEPVEGIDICEVDNWWFNMEEVSLPEDEETTISNKELFSALYYTDEDYESDIRCDTENYIDVEEQELAAIKRIRNSKLYSLLDAYCGNPNQTKEQLDEILAELEKQPDEQLKDGHAKLQTVKRMWYEPKNQTFYFSCYFARTFYYPADQKLDFDEDMANYASSFKDAKERIKTVKTFLEMK